MSVVEEAIAAASDGNSSVTTEVVSELMQKEIVIAG